MPFGSWSHYALAAPSQFALVVVFFMDFAQELLFSAL
jgi:hypothetical protein